MGVTFWGSCAHCIHPITIPLVSPLVHVEKKQQPSEKRLIPTKTAPAPPQQVCVEVGTRVPGHWGYLLVPQLCQPPSTGGLQGCDSPSGANSALPPGSSQPRIPAEPVRGGTAPAGEDLHRYCNSRAIGARVPSIWDGEPWPASVLCALYGVTVPLRLATSIMAPFWVALAVGDGWQGPLVGLGHGELQCPAGGIRLAAWHWWLG